MRVPSRPAPGESEASVDSDRTGEDRPGTTRDVNLGSAGARALVNQFRLTVLEGPDAGRQFVSCRERCVIGTHESADLRLTDDTVSRFHCELVIEPAHVVCRDLESRNGTCVDGVPILVAPLRDNAVLLLGQTRLRFDLGLERVEIPLSSHDRFGSMVGRSGTMRAAFLLLERAAASEATVLIEGETGTGKEAAAEAIHGESSRRDGPFLVVDCGAIPPDLLESELFGHERGAFTGATAGRRGAFRAAAGGSIFLDEIGELGSDLQPKLLRALERREIKPVGSDCWESVDVRLIVATNRDLRTEVNAHRFRSDLYYRLAVLQVRLPPLRERSDDLPVLVDQLLTGLGATGPERARFESPEFLAELQRHTWPGNVRELRNYLERCVVMRSRVPMQGSGEPAQELQRIAVDTGQPLRQARDRLIDEFERSYLSRLIEEHPGNIAAAARAAGVDRTYLYRLLWRHGLR